MPRPLNIDANSLPKTIEDAVYIGSKYYFDGKPCKRGHISIKSIYISNKNKRITTCRECRASCYSAKYNEKNMKDEEHLQQLRGNSDKYRRKYPWKVNEYKQRRKLHIKQATPEWANKEAILDMYKKAQELSLATGEKYSVDHIIPLRGKFVWGLHIEANLQVIKLIDNKKKSNKFI